MKSVSVFVRGAVAIGAAAAAFVVFGTGTSAAKDPFVGLTYAEVTGKIADFGGNAVVATVVGAQLPMDECIVESWHKSSYPERTNFDLEASYLLALNCSAKLAHAGQPGNSLSTPEGRARKEIEVTAERFNDKPELCDTYMTTCKRICEAEKGPCSKEVMSYL